jgi:hypothetical protein
MLSFRRTTISGPFPVRCSNRSPAVDLPLPHALQLLPGRKVTVDLENGVCLPPGHFGQLTLKRSNLVGISLLLHADLVGEPLGLSFFCFFS